MDNTGHLDDPTLSSPDSNEPLEDSRQIRASSRELHARARAARRDAMGLHEQARALLALFDSMLESRSGGQAEQGSRMEELKSRAIGFAQLRRSAPETPEAMLIELKELLAHAAPREFVLRRADLASQITTWAIEGYYAA